MYLQGVLHKPHGNQKAKTYSRFTKEKERGITAHHQGKSPTHKIRQQKKKNGILDLQNSQKTLNKMALVSSYISIINLNVNDSISPI